MKRIATTAIALAVASTALGADDDFTFNPTGFAQFRFLYNGGDQDTRQGFDVRKAVLGIEGTAYGADYKVTGEASSENGFRLRDAWLSNDFGFATVKAGQFKTAFMSEVNVSTVDTLIGDYSVISYTFGQGRSQGVELSREFGDFTLSGAYTDGFNSANTEITSQYDYGFVGRMSYGGLSWVDLGAAVAYNDTDDEGVTSYTFDATFDLSDRLTGSVGYVGRNGESEGWGVVSQLGFDFTDNIQMFGMYEYGAIDSSDLSIATVGINYDICSNVRWTNSVGYSMDGIGSSWDVNDTGWSNGSEDGQYLIRSQITFSF